ncbi:ROK family protein [Nanchangia anserum]|uniref:ROK family protein n=1 Tax=Nanchangia anserum TaxID=2692125 RepID=A0A8I0G9P1_9ACTO|nr:ROK family protein [Nanchangia anserum]MBD3689729.1 ROK family protein [Nanchangia anserum]QOX81900.1 ROK family protein [Nanchangia anserum]
MLLSDQPRLLATHDDLAEVVRLVRANRAHTRAQLCEQTGIGRNAVSNLLSQAEIAGLLERNGNAPSTGGRAPQAWRFADSTASVLTANIATRRYQVALTDLAGNVITEVQREWPIQRGPVETLSRVCDDLTTVIDPERPLWGLGICLPGPIDYATGIPVSPPIMPGWDGFDVIGYVSSRFDVPVTVDNDVNAMALGYPGITGATDAIYVLLGTGIGAGIITRGTIHRGAQGAAGDIGHIPVATHESVGCRCGRTGCLEAIAGGWAIERDAAALSLPGDIATSDERDLTAPASVEQVARAAQSGNSAARSLLSTCSAALGGVLSVLVSFFNPDTIILAGTVPNLSAEFVTNVERIIEAQSLPLASRTLKVVCAPHPTQDATRGCARLVVDKVVAPH